MNRYRDNVLTLSLYALHINGPKTDLKHQINRKVTREYSSVPPTIEWCGRALWRWAQAIDSLSEKEGSKGGALLRFHLFINMLVFIIILWYSAGAQSLLSKSINDERIKMENMTEVQMWKPGLHFN